MRTYRDRAKGGKTGEKGKGESRPKRRRESEFLFFLFTPTFQVKSDDLRAWYNERYQTTPRLRTPYIYNILYITHEIYDMMSRT